MATLEEILAMSAAAGDSDALAALQSNNIGYQLSGVGSSIAELVGKTALQDALANKPVDLKGAAIASALGGLIGGISKGYGNRVLTQEYDDYKNAVTELAAGRPVDESKIGSTVFNLAKNKADIFRAARAADIEKRQNAILDAGLSAAETEKSKATWMLSPEERLLATLSPAQREAAIAKLPEDQQAEVRNLIPDLSKLSPMAKVDRELESELRKDLRTGEVGPKFTQIASSLETLKAFYPQDSRAASLGIVSEFARLLDPGGTVKEGEIKNVENTRNFFSSIGVDLNSWIKGTGTFTNAQKQKIMEVAGAKYNAYGAQYDKLVKNSQALATQSGANASKVFGQVPYEPFSIETFVKNTPTQTKKTAYDVGSVGKLPDGSQMIFGADGRWHAMGGN